MARLLVVVLLGLGLWLRARGYLYATIPLWVDEAVWALRLIELPLKEHLIRPIGFMAISKLNARLLGPSEAVLRALPWFAGVAALLASPALARLLFRSTPARLLFVACIALAPAAIDLTQEFKPYSLGLALHLFMIFLALRYAKTGGVRDLAGALVLAWVSVLFAQDALFAYPGWAFVGTFGPPLSLLIAKAQPHIARFAQALVGPRFHLLQGMTTETAE